MTETDAYILGFFAYWDEAHSNPFRVLTQHELFCAWDDGWWAACSAARETAGA